MTEFYVKHKESATVEADTREAAERKAIEGDAETPWNTVEYEVLEANSLELTDSEKITRIREIISDYDDPDAERDMDSAVTMIRRLVSRGDDE